MAATKSAQKGAHLRLIDWETFVDRLRHLHTTVAADAEEHGVYCGQTQWGATVATGQLVRLAWDWREARPGVVAISNPMSIESDVDLVDDLDRPLDLVKRIVQLNNAVFSLPWQRKVTERIGEAPLRELAWA
jgi:hypothetical protein